MALVSSFRPPSARPEAAAAVIEELRRAGLAATPPLTSTVAALDSFDGRLAAAGLRLRLVDGEWLVLTGAAEEVTATVRLPGQPTRPDELPPGPLRRRLARLLDVRVLLRLLEVTSEQTVLTQRTTLGKATAHATVHRRVRTPDLALGHDVVEVVELAGYAKPAAELRDLVERCGWERSGSDVVELTAAAAGVRLAGYDVPIGVALTPGAPALDGFRAVLANLHEAMVANWDGTVTDVDPEFLHDLRVAVRRARVVLANAGRVIDEQVRQRARAELAWIGAVSGPARDLDVYELEWTSYTAQLDRSAAVALEPLRRHLGELRVAAHAELAGQLTSPRAIVDLDVWERWLTGAVERDRQGDRHDEALARTVARQVRKAHRRMVERGRTITSATPAETVHELRKDGKKLRYLVECFGGLYDDKRRAAFVSRLKALQDVLGSHQDAEVHADALRSLAADPAPAWSTDTLLAIGQLVGRLDHVRRESRAGLAERFADFDRRKTEDALAALLDSASSP